MDATGAGGQHQGGGDDQGGAPATTCGDGVKNGDETDVDCGGSHCAPCDVGLGGGASGNCASPNQAQMDGQATIGNGQGGTSGNNGSWCGCGGEGSAGGGFLGNGGGSGGLSFVNGGNGCTSTRPNQCVDAGFGGFGGGGNGGNGGGGGGGYQGGNAGGPAHAWGRGGLSYNQGADQLNQSGVQTGHGKVVITSL